MTAPPLPPPGWYDDPWGTASRRWWDGAEWTAHTDETYRAAVAVAGVAPADVVPPIRAGGIATVGLVGGMVASTALYLLLRSLGVARSNPLLLVAVQCTLWAGLFGACVAAVRRKGTGRLRDLGLRIRSVDPLLGVGFGIACVLGVGIVAGLLRAFGLQPQRTTILRPVQPSLLATVVVVSIAVVGAPCFEELFFRGLLYGTFVGRWGVAVGVVAQAAVFGLVHLSFVDLGGNVGVFVVIGSLGVVLGAIRHRFGRLGPGMFTHAVYNGVLVALVLAHAASR